jgi:hypothetical protein
MPLSGWLCSLEFDNGWPLAFYVPGIIGVIWFTFWVFLVFDSPSVHPRIAEDEKRYILASTGIKKPIQVCQSIFFMRSGILIKLTVRCQRLPGKPFWLLYICGLFWWLIWDTAGAFACCSLNCLPTWRQSCISTWKPYDNLLNHPVTKNLIHRDSMLPNFSIERSVIGPSIFSHVDLFDRLQCDRWRDQEKQDIKHDLH